MAKPLNHGTYQVWHEGKTHALDVESVGAREVERLTKKRPERWKDNPAVKVHIPNPRPTRVGDVIVDPTCGAWEVQKGGYLAWVEPPPPVKERMEREGIVPQDMQLLNKWIAHMLEVTGQGDVTIAVPKPCDSSTSARRARFQNKDKGKDLGR